MERNLNSCNQFCVKVVCCLYSGTVCRTFCAYYWLMFTKRSPVNMGPVWKIKEPWQCESQIKIYQKWRFLRKEFSITKYKTKISAINNEACCKNCSECLPVAWMHIWACCSVSWICISVQCVMEVVTFWEVWGLFQIYASPKILWSFLLAVLYMWTSPSSWPQRL
jgi:hypothetical protein